MFTTLVVKEIHKIVKTAFYGPWPSCRRELQTWTTQGSDWLAPPTGRLPPGNGHLFPVE